MAGVYSHNSPHSAFLNSLKLSAKIFYSLVIDMSFSCGPYRWVSAYILPLWKHLFPPRCLSFNLSSLIDSKKVYFIDYLAFHCYCCRSNHLSSFYIQSNSWKPLFCRRLEYLHAILRVTIMIFKANNNNNKTPPKPILKVNGLSHN